MPVVLTGLISQLTDGLHATACASAPKTAIVVAAIIVVVRTFSRLPAPEPAGIPQRRLVVPGAAATRQCKRGPQATARISVPRGAR